MWHATCRTISESAARKEAHMSINRLFLSTTATALALSAFTLMPATAQQDQTCDAKVQAYWQQVLQSQNIADADKQQIQTALANALQHVQTGNEAACEQTLQQVMTAYPL
jgi:hypothetical protein